jgi:hypothetical protein
MLQQTALFSDERNEEGQKVLLTTPYGVIVEDMCFNKPLQVKLWYW